MNIFTNPSWYPSKDKPRAGIFIKDQIFALGKNCLKDNFIVAHWGGEATKIILVEPKNALRHIANFSKMRPFRKKLTNNIWELQTPALEWTPRFFKGNLYTLINATRKNWYKAKKEV